MANGLIVDLPNVRAIPGHDRKSVRCESCSLVQFRGSNDLCRRCRKPLPPLPPPPKKILGGRLNEKRSMIALLLAEVGSVTEVAKVLKTNKQCVKNELRLIYAELGITEGVKSVTLACMVLQELMEKSAREGKISDDYPLPQGIASFLREREIFVARRVAEGLKDREIADKFGRDVSHVKNILRGIYDKLGVFSRLELALRVFQEQFYAQ